MEPCINQFEKRVSSRSFLIVIAEFLASNPNVSKAIETNLVILR